MVNSVFEYGLNDRGSVEYTINQESHNDMVTVMRGGDPEITKQLILKNRNKWKYTSGVLSFVESDLSLKKKNKIMQLFEKTFLPGIEHGDYNILWAQHLDKGTLELHWVIPRTELSTGKSLAVYIHKRDLKKNDLFQSLINSKFNLESPIPKDEYITLKDKDSEGETITISRADTKALKKELDREIRRHALENKKRYSSGKFDSVSSKEKIQLIPLKKENRNDRIRRKIDDLNRRKIEGTKRRSEEEISRTPYWTEATESAKRLNNRVATDAYQRGKQRRRSNQFITKVGGNVSGILSRFFDAIRRKTLSWYREVATREEARLLKEKRERETLESMKEFHAYDIDSQSVLDWLVNQDFDDGVNQVVKKKTKKKKLRKL